MRHSKVKQFDIDKIVPTVIFHEENDTEKAAEQEQRDLERSGSYMQSLRTPPVAGALTAPLAEAICETMLLVREHNAQIPF